MQTAVLQKRQHALTGSLRIPKRNAKSSKENFNGKKRHSRKRLHCLFCQKSKCDLGGSRGRMISASDRENAVQLIEEAVESGASCEKACEKLGITERTYYRWKKRKGETQSYEDGRPTAIHPKPSNKIPEETRRQIIDTCNSAEYASMPPCEIVPSLADKGIYIASESTFYRVLREEKMLNHRGRSEAPKHNRPATYSADAPNQVYMWDITYLNGPHKGMFYYLYLFPICMTAASLAGKSTKKKAQSLPVTLLSVSH